MTDVLDSLSVLQIEMAAITACTDRQDFDPLRAPGEQMVDNDYRAAIREFFATEAEWQEWMVEPLLVEMKRHVRMRDAAYGLAGLVMGGML